MGRSLRLIAILAFASLAVTACGKRGALEPPGVAEGTPKASSNSASKEKKTEDEGEHRGFILDPLLR